MNTLIKNQIEEDLDIWLVNQYANNRYLMNIPKEKIDEQRRLIRLKYIKEEPKKKIKKINNGIKNVILDEAVKKKEVKPKKIKPFTFEKSPTGIIKNENEQVFIFQSLKNKILENEILKLRNENKDLKERLDLMDIKMDILMYGYHKQNGLPSYIEMIKKPDTNIKKSKFIKFKDNLLKFILKK